MDIRWQFGFLVVLISTLAVSPFPAVASEDQPPGAKAREDVEFLVDSVESTYDCEFTLDTLVTRLDAINGHFTVVVQLDGSECDEAFRALTLRSMAFPFSFMALPEPDSEKTKTDSKNDT